MSRIPRCANCGVEHSWLLNMNGMVLKVEWECNECGYEERTTFPIERWKDL